MEYLLGVVVSLLTQAAKKWGQTDMLGTHLALLSLSIIGASAYVYLSASDLWPAIVQILLTASAFHNLVIRKLED